MSEEIRTKEPQCNCPSGSYHIKHTNSCYEAQIAHHKRELVLMTELKDAVNDTLRQVVTERNQLREQVKAMVDIQKVPHS